METVHNYTWREMPSLSTGNHYPSKLVVSATTVELARAKAMAMAPILYRDNKFKLPKRHWIRDFEADLQQMPEITYGVTLILGDE